MRLPPQPDAKLLAQRALMPNLRSELLPPEQGEVPLPILAGLIVQVFAFPVRQLDRFLLWFLLAALGLGLEIACYLSGRFRAQIYCNMTVEVGSEDGVRHHYVFTPRKVVSRLGAVPNPDLALYFNRAREGFFVLISPWAIHGMVLALHGRRANYVGNAANVLWFYGLTRFVLPILRQGPLRRSPPGAYLKPTYETPVQKMKKREPAVFELDPNWIGAKERRDNMAMVRESSGRRVAKW